MASYEELEKRVRKNEITLAGIQATMKSMMWMAGLVSPVVTGFIFWLLNKFGG